jgi:hypothetical protein
MKGLPVEEDQDIEQAQAAMVEQLWREAYRAGREDAARDIEAIAEEAGWGEVWAQCVSLARGTSSIGHVG